MALMGNQSAEIPDLCATFEAFGSASLIGSSCSFHLGTSVGDGLRGVYSARAAVTKDYVDLETILYARSRNAERLSLSERVDLIVAISSAMNELFTTGWLDKPWEKRDILIPVLLKGQLGPLYEAVRPYLVRHFEGSSPR